jgi:hypothetical protein
VADLWQGLTKVQLIQYNPVIHAFRGGLRESAALQPGHLQQRKNLYALGPYYVTGGVIYNYGPDILLPYYKQNCARNLTKRRN